jgi:murein DD-endopeptidase MepM/ murein hydrolase activator NlpD
MSRHLRTLPIKFLTVKKIAILISILIFMPSTAHAEPIYTFPVPTCKVTYARAHHDYPANDILGKKGCPFVAVTSGEVVDVNRIDRYKWNVNDPATRGGRWVAILGDDGVRYYGSHLQSVAPGIEVGVRVNAGDLLGKLGDSGDAKGTSPHVHFGISWNTDPSIWWVRRGQIAPWDYLDAWKKGEDKSPAKAVSRKMKKIGEIPPIPKK